MFPEGFVAKQVELFTKPGDYTFDPFSGRGTTVLQSLLMNRNSAAVDINPVAYCVSAAKAQLPNLDSIRVRISELETGYLQSGSGLPGTLPRFFTKAFHQQTLSQLLFLRSELQWRSNCVDRFIAALVLGSMHGEMDKSQSYFSNQMPRTISTKPGYSIRYWDSHKLVPPRRQVFQLLSQRAGYRLSTGKPSLSGSVALGDARDVPYLFSHLFGRVNLFVTSPPYLNVTRYEEDQWLRLWFLGHKPIPTYSDVSQDDRHSSVAAYSDFLEDVWEGIQPLAAKNAIMVCRIAGKNVSRKELTEILEESISHAFRRAYLIYPPQLSKIRNKQTDKFRPGSKGCFFEVDYVFKLN
jgi:hypothetical protein